MLKAPKVYCYEQGCNSVLSIGGDDLAKSTIFRYLGRWFSKIDTSADVQFFVQSEVKTKTMVITFADAQFWDMKILEGCCRIIGGDTSLHEFAPMVMKRFEIIEKLCLSKASLKMAGGGKCIPHTPLDPPLQRSYRFADVRDCTQIPQLALELSL